MTKIRDWLLAGTTIPLLAAGPTPGLSAQALSAAPIVVAQNMPDFRRGEGTQMRPGVGAGQPRPMQGGNAPHPAPAMQPAPRQQPEQRMAPAPMQQEQRMRPAPQEQQMRPAPVQRINPQPQQPQQAAPRQVPAQGGMQPGSEMQPRRNGMQPGGGQQPDRRRFDEGQPQQPRMDARPPRGAQPGQPAVAPQPAVPMQPNVPGQPPRAGVPNQPPGAMAPPAGQRRGFDEGQPQRMDGQPPRGNQPGQPPAGFGGQPPAPGNGRPDRAGGNFPAPPPPPPPPGAGAPQPADAQGRPRRGPGIGGVAAGAAAGFVGGFLAAEGFNRLDDIRRHRQEMNEDGVDIIREPGRTIVREDDRVFIAHDENQRFRDLGYDVRSERQGGYDVAVYDRPDGSRIYTYTDGQGRLVRRVRQFPDGRQVFLIDNRYNDPDRDFRRDIVVLPPPGDVPPPDQYVVDADNADEGTVYDALEAPPVAPLPQRYTLDQIRYSPDLRARMRSVDLNTINFATGSWTVTADQAGRLSAIAQAINRAVQRNPQEVFMIEGYTDAVGSPVDNLSLSDRRAQSVATILTQNFQVPAENLVTQGYGAQFLKVNTQAANAQNRRVTVRRITPLLNQK